MSKQEITLQVRFDKEILNDIGFRCSTKILGGELVAIDFDGLKFQEITTSEYKDHICEMQTMILDFIKHLESIRLGLDPTSVSCYETIKLAKAMAVAGTKIGRKMEIF